MRLFDRLRFLLRPWRSRRRVHEEIDEELRFHIERETERNVERGLSFEEARRKAVIEFGGMDRYKEEVREVDGVSIIEKIWTDLRYGARVLRRNRSSPASRS